MKLTIAFCVSLLAALPCCAQNARPSDLQKIGGFLDFCDAGPNRPSRKTVEKLKSLPAGEATEGLKKALSDAVADEALCLGYINGLYEGWKEGHDHGVMVAHIHGAVPSDLSTLLKTMPSKEIDSVVVDMKTDIACVPDKATFGELNEAVISYFRNEVNKSPLLGLTLTSRGFSRALLSSFPCSQ